MAQARVTFNVDDALATCEKVVVQVQAASETDKEKAALGRMFARVADKIMEQPEGSEDYPIRDLLDSLDHDDDGAVDTEYVISALYKWGQVLSPLASTTWNREEVTALVDKITAMRTLDLLTDDQNNRATAIIEQLGSLRKGGGTGQRSPRTEQPPVEGRPYERVRVVTIDNGNEIASQAANKANSTSNIKTRVVNALKGAGVSLTDTQEKEILALVKTVVEEGKPEVTIMGLLKVEPVPAS